MFQKRKFSQTLDLFENIVREQIEDALGTIDNKAERVDILYSLVEKSMLVHISNDDEVYWSDDNSSSFGFRVKYLTQFALPMLLNLQIDFTRGQAFVSITDLKDNQKNTFSGENRGMTEIAPIDATSGDIHSPNTKSNFISENEENKEYFSFNMGIEKIRMAHSEYLQTVNKLHRIYSQLIVQWTTIY